MRRLGGKKLTDKMKESDWHPALRYHKWNKPWEHADPLQLLLLSLLTAATG